MEGCPFNEISLPSDESGSFGESISTLRGLVCSLSSCLYVYLTTQPDDTHIAAGMTDGTLAVRRREAKATEEAAAEAKQQALQSGSYEYFADMEAVFGTGYVKAKGKDLPPVVGPADEYKVETKRRLKLKEFDKMLKGFKYSNALDAGIKKVSVGLGAVLGGGAENKEGMSESGMWKGTHKADARNRPF